MSDCDFNVNGFRVHKAKNHPVKVDISNIEFNLYYRDTQGREVRGYRRRDVRRIILDNGKEVSHAWATNNLTYLGKRKPVTDPTTGAVLTEASGGNNRQWTNAYKAMKAKLTMLEKLPTEFKDEKMEWFLRGYKDAIQSFEDGVTNKLTK